jgi:hypothetical protein
MMNKLNALPLKEGDVVDFHHLHPHKYKEVGDFLRVEGKPRRLLIVRKCYWLDWSSIQPTNERTLTNDCDWYDVKGHPGYVVLSLVSKCPYGLEAIHSKPIKNLLGEGQESVIYYVPVIYPVACYRHGGRKKSVDPLFMATIWEELSKRGLSVQGLDPQFLGNSE